MARKRKRKHRKSCRGVRRRGPRSYKGYVRKFGLRKGRARWKKFKKRHRCGRRSRRR